MKKFNLLLLAASFIIFAACGGGGDDKKKDGETKEQSAKCDETNNVEIMKVDSVDLDFEIVEAFGNHVEGVSYRVIFTNYPFEEFSEYADLEEGKVKMVIGIFNPTGGEFMPGDYTYNGETNKVAFTLENGPNNVYHNTAGIDDPGKVVITHIDNNKICGTAHLIGQGGNEIKVSFSADHKDL